MCKKGLGNFSALISVENLFTSFVKISGLSMLSHPDFYMACVFLMYLVLSITVDN